MQIYLKKKAEASPIASAYNFLIQVAKMKLLIFVGEFPNLLCCACIDFVKYKRLIIK